MQRPALKVEYGNPRSANMAALDVLCKHDCSLSVCGVRLSQTRSIENAQSSLVETPFSARLWYLDAAAIAEVIAWHCGSCRHQ